MIMASIQNGWLEKDKVVLETLLCVKRSGARGILSYFSPYAAEKIINK